jgi:hypothetical protein
MTNKTPNPKNNIDSFGHWDLGFGWILGFGHWDLIRVIRN